MSHFANDISLARLVINRSPLTLLLAAHYMCHGVKPRIALQAATVIRGLRAKRYEVLVRIHKGEVMAEAHDINPQVFKYIVETT
jgi:hypothetical protein